MAFLGPYSNFLGERNWLVKLGSCVHPGSINWEQGKSCLLSPFGECKAGKLTLRKRYGQVN